MTVICLGSTGLTSVYFVLIINRALFGKLEEDITYLPRVESYERVPAIILAALIVLLGVQPNIVISHTQVTTDALVAGVSQNSATLALLKVNQPETSINSSL